MLRIFDCMVWTPEDAADVFDRMTCGSHPWCTGCEYEDEGDRIRMELDKEKYNYREEYFRYMEDWPENG